MHIALNGLHNKLGIPLNRDPDLYNQFYFNGDHLTNASIDMAHGGKDFIFSVRLQ
jgi:hypothetical protein